MEEEAISCEMERLLMLRSKGLKVRCARNNGWQGLRANTGDSLYRLRD